MIDERHNIQNPMILWVVLIDQALSSLLMPGADNMKGHGLHNQANRDALFGTGTAKKDGGGAPRAAPVSISQEHSSNRLSVLWASTFLI